MKHAKHPATIIAAAALFMALGGGAYAAAQTLISGSQIKNHSIAKKKLTNAAIAQLKGQKGDPGPSNAYSAFNASLVNFGSSVATVDTLTLAAGSYVVMGNVTLYDTVADDNNACFLVDPSSSTIDVSYVSYHVGSLADGQNTASLLAPLTTTGGDVTLQCVGGDAGATGIDARIIAIKVGSVAGTLGHFHGARRTNASG